MAIGLRIAHGGSVAAIPSKAAEMIEIRIRLEARWCPASPHYGTLCALDPTGSAVPRQSNGRWLSLLALERATACTQNGRSCAQSVRKRDRSGRAATVKIP
jgi:hypothetical protein